MIARIKGNGSKRPILLMAHTDVVGVQRERWPLDPFERLLESSLYGLVDFTWNAVSGVAVR